MEKKPLIVCESLNIVLNSRLCVRDAGADAADGGYLWRSMWIFVVDDFFSLITFYKCFSFSTFTLSNTYSCILAKMQ